MMPYTDKTLITRPLQETPEQRKARELRKEPLPHVSYCVSRAVVQTSVQRKEDKK